MSLLFLGKWANIQNQYFLHIMTCLKLVSFTTSCTSDFDTE